MSSQRVLSELPTSKELKQTAHNNSRLLLTKVQFQLPLKPINMSSKPMPVEFLTQLTAVLTLTTESSLLVMVKRMVKNTTLLRTHGAQHGVIMDM